MKAHEGRAGATDGSLREYRRKRRFSRTPEPEGAAAPARAEPPGGERVFVIQKHAATRLHYDFRLELEGVLKSWAVPKGPSLDPADKRLAMHVEDHPLEYGDFEGIIPKGEYGGGTVMLWDHGTWTPEGDPHRDYRAGSLKFSLHGEKLRGSWALVRIRDRRQTRDDERSWLLIKHDDEAARPAARYQVVDAEPDSVVTGRSMEQIAAAQDRVWHSNRGAGAQDDGAAGRPSARAGGRSPSRAASARAGAAAPARIDPAQVEGARPASLPRFVPPQLATLVSQAPVGDDWLHEMKFDGYRILARREDDDVTLRSRNGRAWTDHFPAVADSVRALPARQLLLDGEVAVVTRDGRTSFQALQNLMSSAGGGGALVYMVFDLLHVDGYDLTRARLEDRKAALARLLGAPGGEPGALRYSDHVVGSGAEFFAEACRLGLEGVVSKRRGAPYRSTRGADWVKTKCLSRQEVVIGGYTDPEGSRSGIGALLTGVYEDGRLVYVGKVGTGFTARTLQDLKERLTPLEQPSSPFSARLTGLGRPHWVRPELVAEVNFGEWTADGRMRHPSFQGLREDKPAAQVVRERPATPPEDERPEPPRPRREAPASTSAGPSKSRDRRRAGNARGGGPAGDGASSGEAAVAGVRITHPDRVLYPPQGITKIGLARFYESIAEWILPHLRDRPTTLVRCPDGAHKTCFYQKHTGYWAPDTVRRVPIKEKTKTGEYLVVDDLPGLIGLVQIGILEIHTWNSTVSELERPDRIVIDLDPGDGVPWSRVVAGARLVRARLEAAGLQSFVKTTGGKGLHVVAPLIPRAGWDECAAFARRMAEEIARDEPRRYLARMARSERAGRIFVDYLRNVRGATSVAAYSTRARPDAPVSVPLDWDELSPRVRSDHYTVTTLPRRLAALRADPWTAYRTVRQSLPEPERGATTRR